MPEAATAADVASSMLDAVQGRDISVRGTISVADPDPGSGAFLTPGSRMGRKSASGSGKNNPDHIFQSLETISLVFLGVKILKFFDLDLESGMETVRIRYPGSGMEKSRIRDPG